MGTLITLNNAKKKFGTASAFDNVQLTINQGDVVALAGPNGGGKTTLLRCLMGMLDFDNPRGQSLLGSAFPVSLETRRELMYLPDDDGLIEDLTAEEYFQFIASSYRVGLDKVSKAIDVLENLDFDLFNVNKLIKSYSHGMRKKVQLAAIVIPEVKAIIIDEPTNGLDPTAIILARKFISDIKSRQQTIIISTHNLAFAEQLANRVILIKNKILYDGPTKWLLRDLQAQNLEEAYTKIVLGLGREGQYVA